MSGFRTVLLKECRDNFRDRRTILSSFSLALLGPLLFIGLMSFVLNTAIGESSEPAALSITGATFLKSRTGRRGLAMRRLNHVYVGTSDEFGAAAVRVGEIARQYESGPA